MNLEKIVNLCKQYGFIFQGSEIYGGLANSWDYGPLGVELKNNIKKAWIKKFVQENKLNVNMDSAILMNPKVWEASMHITNFNDPLIDCKECKSRFRADQLIENFDNSLSVEGLSNDQLKEIIIEKNIVCPKCGKLNYTDIRKFNMMFKTHQGVFESENNVVYLRPETAQGIFVNFLNVQRSLRLKLPFGICQIGKSFRNEITPGNFIFRTREFEQMELEFFCKPGTEIDWFNFYKDFCMNFLINLNINYSNLRIRDHSKEELSHYSNATSDIEYNFPFGWGELWGIASRTDFDLKQHMKFSNQNMQYFDEESNSKYIPFVVEPSLGVDRLFLAILCDAYKEDVVNNEKREILSLHPFLSPYKLSVLPLIKKRHSEKSLEIFSELSKHFMCSYDESGNIGKRYRRQDVIGTPFCITVDDESLENGTVTIRNRDSMVQEVINISDIIDYINSKIKY